MDDKMLDKCLDSLKAPEPSPDLGQRILRAAKTPVEQNISFSKKFMPIAATILAIAVIGYTGLNTLTNTETESMLWQEAANDLGFDDIYDWVENEDISAQ